jgi:NTP pyrophosphatase (non-canonical NTP hydrolase)
MTRTAIAFPVYVNADGPIPLAIYQRAVADTDRLPPRELMTPAMGLFGEIGSLLATIKKRRRDTAAYATYDASVNEELGDILWYLTCIVSRAGFDLSALASRDVGVGEPSRESISFGTVQGSRLCLDAADVLESISLLAEQAGKLVRWVHKTTVWNSTEQLADHLVAILYTIATAAATAQISLDSVARYNLEKTFGRWPIERRYPTIDDSDLPANERLPARFELVVREQDVGGKIYVVLERNGVIIGDRLTDNKRETDDYRFHDVFHIAYAVHLGWSPVLRTLFRVKRKSRPELDENEDGARAMIIEEGIATFIFGRALKRNLFENLDELDYDLLKLVQEFVRGFEPEHCALWQWEQAILDGFKLFRAFKRFRKGRIRADLRSHTLDFEPIQTEQNEDQQFETEHPTSLTG